MSDILYLAIGLGAFVLLALYASSLGRICGEPQWLNLSSASPSRSRSASISSSR